MIIEETFYTISKSELMCLCRQLASLDKQDFLMNFFARVESLTKEQRISELKFKVHVNND